MQVGGMHPTGMLSCLILQLIKTKSRKIIASWNNDTKSANLLEKF